jgi:hypothetical protein
MKINSSHFKIIIGAATEAREPANRAKAIVQQGTACKAHNKGYYGIISKTAGTNAN